MNFDQEKIYTKTQFYSNDGYFYFSMTNSTVLKLNEDLQIVQSKKLKGFIRSHSVLEGEVGVCSRIYDSEFTTECLKLDGNLKIKDRYRLGSSTDTRIRTLHNLKDGSSLLLTIKRGLKTKVEVRRLMSGGFISQPEVFSYDCGNFVSNPPGQFIELDGVYCFVFQCKSEAITHCINAKDAKKLSKSADLIEEDDN